MSWLVYYLLLGRDSSTRSSCPLSLPAWNSLGATSFWSLLLDESFLAGNFRYFQRFFDLQPNFLRINDNSRMQRKIRKIRHNDNFRLRRSFVGNHRNILARWSSFRATLSPETRCDSSCHRKLSGAVRRWILRGVVVLQWAVKWLSRVNNRHLWMREISRKFCLKVNFFFFIFYLSKSFRLYRHFW